MNSAAARIRAVFADAGCHGNLRAQAIGRPDIRIDVGGAEPVVAASVYKIVVLVAAVRAFDDDVLDPAATVRIVPAECTPGPTGLSVFSDPVVLSWRDIARSMITVSDNAAADVLLGAVGMDRVANTMADLGLHDTQIIGGTAELHRQVIHDTGALTLAEAVGLLASDPTITSGAVFDPAYTTATSAIDTNAVLDAIWSGTAASPAGCGYMRTVLSQQIWPHRIRSAFPFPDVGVAGKTGTIGHIRNEVAVVTFPHETPIAVSVFTRAARSDSYLPIVDRAIGSAARIAVTALRTGS